MKSMVRMVCVGAMAFGATTVFAADPLTNDQRVKWLSTVTDGCYNDPANWTDGILPANGIDGRYGGNRRRVSVAGGGSAAVLVRLYATHGLGNRRKRERDEDTFARGRAHACDNRA